jgi:hypothetical protein
LKFSRAVQLEIHHLIFTFVSQIHYNPNIFGLSNSMA